MTDFVIFWLLVSVVHFKKKRARVKLLARAKLIFLGEQPDDFFSVWNPALERWAILSEIREKRYT